MGINIYGRTPSHLYDIYSVDNYEQHTQRRTCMRINIFICVSISGDSIGHESGLLGYSDLSCQWRIPGEWTLGLDPPLLVLYRFIVQSISKARPVIGLGQRDARFYTLSWKNAHYLQAKCANFASIILNLVNK